MSVRGLIESTTEQRWFGVLLAICLLLLHSSCQSDTAPYINDGNDIDLLVDADPTSGDVAQEPMVKFADEPAYNGDNTKISFKVVAANDSAVSYAYYFAAGDNVSCDNFTTTGSGAFNAVIELDDTDPPGKRIICIRGIDAKGNMSDSSESEQFAKPAPQDATVSVKVLVEITPDGKMTITKEQGSAATSVKWCVIDAADTQGNANSCPMPDDTSGEYKDSEGCKFAAGTLDTPIDDLGIGAKAAGSKLIACAVGMDSSGNEFITYEEFTKGTAAKSESQSDSNNQQQLGREPNAGNLVQSHPGLTGYFTTGKHICNTMPFYDNTGTDEITVGFTYLNDKGTNKERRLKMFSDIIVKTYPIDNHTQEREQLVNRYCRNDQLGGGYALQSGGSFKLPAKHRALTILKSKGDPYGLNHDPKYFNTRGYACVQIELKDLNNSKIITNYRCARRAELALQMGTTRLKRDSNNEYTIEISRSKNRHRKFTVVNAVSEMALKAGASKEYVEKSYDKDLIWEIVGYTGESVPAWLYYVGANFTKNDNGQKKEITAANQFQIGIRGSVVDAGNADLPPAGTHYRFLLLSNSLLDKPCQTQKTGDYFIYTTHKHNARGGEKRKTKMTKLKFCPRQDVLNIKIVK